MLGRDRLQVAARRDVAGGVELGKRLEQLLGAQRRTQRHPDVSLVLAGGVMAMRGVGRDLDRASPGPSTRSTPFSFTSSDPPSTSWRSDWCG